MSLLRVPVECEREFRDAEPECFCRASRALAASLRACSVTSNTGMYKSEKFCQHALTNKNHELIILSLTVAKQKNRCTS